MKLSDDYFQLLQLPETFAIDAAVLSENYRSLQRQFHPDRFVGKSSQEQRLAVQMASAVNQACDTLRSPLLRAAYLLQRRGLEVDGNATTDDVAFLLEQMNIRERLAALDLSEDSFAELAIIGSGVASSLAALEALFADHYQNKSYDTAAETLMKMQFYNKLQIEIDQIEESLEEG